MTADPFATYSTLDWDQLWRNARSRKSWGSSSAADWDKKAVSFAARNQSSPFVSLVLAHIPLTPTATVLDVGCGSGTLALPIARQVSSVTAVDFSAGMLTALRQMAAAADITNITTIEAGWEDDWSSFGIQRHDIAIASRSLAVADLRAALQRLNDYAAAYVIIVDRIAPTPFDPEAFAAVGRPFECGPDYIYVINTLYSMGIHANVDIIGLDRETAFADLDDAMDSYRWMIRDMSPAEESALRLYLAQKSRPGDDGRIVVDRGFRPQWACIWWDKKR
ncbi:MAG TPA: class I SAM-dependent methyltransferase [Desulfoprunum sp.]|nr:class I SAM-dependent methyltransferase [Desulfoprunum sp.]